MQQRGLRGRLPEATGQRLIVMTLDHAGAANHQAQQTAHLCKQLGRTLATLPEAPVIRIALFAFLGCALVASNLLELRIDNLILGLARRVIARRGARAGIAFANRFANL
jgi:hypothetical protein